MDSIRDKTSQIRNAVYGKDVRESIASGIEIISDREDLFEQTINASEITRQNNETLRQSNETTRVSNENLRQSSEATRVDNETLRKSNETTRSNNETLRQSSEATRVDNETLRQSNETTRVDNESLRQTNEIIRQNEENTREANEDTRISEENSRKTSEATRVDNETLRQSNETTRVNNETLRQSNETTRVNQENIRKDNETTRQDQENTRKDNETARQNSINALKVNEPYDPNHDYVPLNKVTYQGSSYLNIIPCRGVLPTNTDNWLCIASKGLDGIGAGDMTKMIYDKDDDGVVDHAEVADSVEWSNVKTKPDLTVYAEKTYVDEQIQTITETGIPKLVSYEYDLYATEEGQRVFEIPYDYYSHVTDTLIVETGANMPKSYYTITDPVTNPDNSITKGFITLTEGRPNGSFLKMRILKNVPLGPDGAISGAVMAIDSIPQNRVQGLEDLDNTVNTHLADYSIDIGVANAYKINLTPSPTSYEIGKIYKFKAKSTNTGASTFQIDSLSSIPIKKNVSSDLVSGDIIAGQIILVVYDGTNMQIIGVPGITSVEKANFNNHVGALVTDAGGVHGLKAEIGVFTPIITDDGGHQPTIYNFQNGNYYRMGNRVFFDIYVGVNTKGSSLIGGIYIVGLPFSEKNIPGMYSNLIVGEYAKINRGTQVLAAYIAPNESKIILKLCGDNSAAVLLNANNITDGSYFQLSGNYLIKEV